MSVVDAVEEGAVEGLVVGELVVPVVPVDVPVGVVAVVPVDVVVGVAVEVEVVAVVVLAVSGVLSEGAPLQAKSRDSRGVYTSSLRVRWEEGSALAHLKGLLVECFDASGSQVGPGLALSIAERLGSSVV